MDLDHLIFCGLLLLCEMIIYITENKFLRGSVVREKLIIIYNQKIQPKTIRFISALTLLIVTLTTTAQITSTTYFLFCILGEYAICAIDQDPEELCKFKLEHRIFTISTFSMILIICGSRFIATYLGRP